MIPNDGAGLQEEAECPSMLWRSCSHTLDQNSLYAVDSCRNTPPMPLIRPLSRAAVIHIRPPKLTGPHTHLPPVINLSLPTVLAHTTRPPKHTPPP